MDDVQDICRELKETAPNIRKLVIGTDAEVKAIDPKKKVMVSIRIKEFLDCVVKPEDLINKNNKIWQLSL